MIIDELVKQGVIKHKIFSFQIGEGYELSKVTFGGYNLQKYARGNLTWHNLLGDRYWTLPMKKAMLGDQVLKPTVDKVIIDTGTSFFLMPTEDFEDLTSYFSKNYTCGSSSIYNNLFVCDCTP